MIAYYDTVNGHLSDSYCLGCLLSKHLVIFFGFKPVKRHGDVANGHIHSRDNCGEQKIIVGHRCSRESN